MLLKCYYDEKMLFSFSVDSDYIFWPKCSMPIIAVKFQKQVSFFLAKRGRRPRVAGFIILSLKGLRRDEISCGVYGHIYLFIYLFIYL